MTVLFLHELRFCYFFLYLAIFMFLFSISSWFFDIIIEGTYEGHHTLEVQNGLRLGFVLFIISEIMFFFSFFWAFFHSSVAPSYTIGCVWPPVGLETLNPWTLPFLNTIILLLSGVTVTVAHRFIIIPTKFGVKNRRNFIRFHRFLGNLFYTICLGGLFTLLQAFEYVTAPFSIADGIYGSIFYVTTGFHGLHVIIGTIFLIICAVRGAFYHFSWSHHVGLECAIWYWHFVDVVWLLLFISIYWWGS